jgi:hypothetical protein
MCAPRAQRELGIEASLFVNSGELAQLGVGIGGKLAGFAMNVGLFRVALRAHGNVFARGHRQGAGGNACDPGEQHRFSAGRRRGDAHHQAGRRNDPVVGTEHRGAQPTGAAALVSFVMTPGSRHEPSCARAARCEQGGVAPVRVPVPARCPLGEPRRTDWVNAAATAAVHPH